MGRSISTTVLLRYQRLERETKHSTVEQTRKSAVEWYPTGLGSFSIPMDFRFPFILVSRAFIIIEVTRSYD